MERLFEQFKVYLLTEKRVSTNTLEAYSADLRQLLDFIEEKSLLPEDIQQAYLKEFLAALKKQELSARSMARKVSSIKAFFGYISRYHGLENCSESLIFPKLDKRLPQCLSEHDVEALLTVAAADHTKMGFANRAMLTLVCDWYENKRTYRVVFTDIRMMFIYWLLEAREAREGLYCAGKRSCAHRSYRKVLLKCLRTNSYNRRCPYERFLSIIKVA
jgi:hypothetical protein